MNNATAIQAKLTACQNQWSQGRNHPTKGKQFQSFLGEIPRIKTLMANDAECHKEAAEAKKLLSQRQAQALQEFDEQARIAAGKGYLTSADVTALATRFKATTLAVGVVGVVSYRSNRR